MIKNRDLLTIILDLIGTPNMFPLRYWRLFSPKNQTYVDDPTSWSFWSSIMSVNIRSFGPSTVCFEEMIMDPGLTLNSLNRWTFERFLIVRSFGVMDCLTL